MPIDAGLIQSDSADFATETAAESLRDAWAIALTQVPGIQASRWQSSAARKGLRAARAEQFLSVTATCSYSVFDNPLTINAPVPTVRP